MGQILTYREVALCKGLKKRILTVRRHVLKQNEGYEKLTHRSHTHMPYALYLFMLIQKETNAVCSN
jgi:hypothetical protein